MDMAYDIDMADQSWNLCICGNVEELFAVLVEAVSECTSCVQL